MTQIATPATVNHPEALTLEQINHQLSAMSSSWKLVNLSVLNKSWFFTDFHHTMAFVNAIAWFAHQENHHPDLEIGYNYCHVSLTTHALNGLSAHDFSFATRIDALKAG
jgi:4a-hydroxytetrahydrobiopterin dehydratase